LDHSFLERSFGGEWVLDYFRLWHKADMAAGAADVRFQEQGGLGAAAIARLACQLRSHRSLEYCFLHASSVNRQATPATRQHL
jgi:hypothetical protein